MSAYLKLLTIVSTIFITSCAIQDELKPMEVEQEFSQEELTSKNTPYELTDVKNPEKFVKYYLRSKISLYNSNNLSDISQNYYKLALENPENLALQEEAFLLLLASQNYAKAITISENKPETSEDLTFETLFDYSLAIAKEEHNNAHDILKEILSTQHRLPFLKILNEYLAYQEHQDIEILESKILAIKSSVALDGFKYYYIARAYEATENYNKAFEYYYTAFSKHTLRTEDVFVRMVYTAKQIDESNLKSLFRSNNKYGENIYLVDQAFIDISKLKPLDNSLKNISAQVLYDLGWSINQTTADLSGLDFLALSDYVAPSDKAKFQLAKGYYSNTWDNDAKELLKSVKIDSDYYLSSQIVLADMYKSKNPEKAIAIIKKLKQKNLFNKYYLDGILGQIYLNNDQFKLAISSFTQALNNDKSSKIYFSRAVAYEKTKQINKAIKDLEIALKKNDKNPIILNYLGYLLIDLNKQPEQGLEYIKQAVRLDPKSPSSLDSLGWAYIKLKEYKKGLAILEKVYDTEQQDGVITGHLGDAYLHNGRLKEAIIYWKKALELEADDPREINRIKQQLYKYNK